MAPQEPEGISSGLNQFMPEFKMRQIDRIRLGAPIERAWPVVRNLDTYELPISKFLFNLRRLPDWIRQKNTEFPDHSRINDFTGPDKGFKILSETPGREVVIGSVGKFWQSNIDYVHVNSEEFRDFKNSGFGKLAWNLRLDPDMAGGSWLTLELRVTSTDDEAWVRFKRYWLMIGNFSHMLRRMALEMFKKKLSSTDEEKILLPGDDLIATPRFQKTMAISIEKPPQKVWPWLVQMGCRRGGWYSIDRLDNGGVPSSWKIIPELQSLKVGDVLPATPKGKTGFVVRSIDLQNSLVLSSPPVGERGEQLPFRDSWAFVLEPIGQDATRLLTRVRADYDPGLRSTILRTYIGPIHYIMQSAQLKNIKSRVERFGSVDHG